MCNPKDNPASDAEIQFAFGCQKKEISQLRPAVAQIPEPAESGLSRRQAKYEMGNGYFIHQDCARDAVFVCHQNLYDNSIVAYKTGTEQNTNLVLNTIRAAKRKEKVTAEVQLHSDQGFQYTSQAYFRLKQSYGITSSMSRLGNPYDNALAENFFSILKTECIYRTKLKTYEQARLLIGEYIRFYNDERIQLKTKLTPSEKRSQYVA